MCNFIFIRSIVFVFLSCSLYSQSNDIQISLPTKLYPEEQAKINTYLNRVDSISSTEKKGILYLSIYDVYLKSIYYFNDPKIDSIIYYADKHKSI
ncbi:exported hypothetical protein [Tenacibaculum sediminilitoris]